MRNVERSPRVLGGLALLLVLACSSSAVPRAEARALPPSEHGRGPGGGSHLAGAQLASDELCAPKLEPTPREGLFAQPGRIASTAEGPGDHPDDLCDDGWTPPPFQDEHPAVDVDTYVVPGSPLRQIARITNTGDTLLVGIVAELDIGSCAHRIGLLEPGDSTAEHCFGPPPQNGRAAAEVLGRSPFGEFVSAEDQVGITPPPAPPPPPVPHPVVQLTVGPPTPGTGRAPAEVPVRITNPSPVALRHVDVAGFPPSCGRSFDRIEPGRSVGYDCPARPGDTVDLTVSARAEGGFLPEGAVVTAGARALVPPAPPPPPERASSPRERPQPAPVPPEPPAPPRKDLSDAEQGPLSSPARTAGVISIAAVLVMMVSVGALSTATRPGK